MTLVIQFPQFGCVILNVLLQLKTQELDVNSSSDEAMQEMKLETQNGRAKTQCCCFKFSMSKNIITFAYLCDLCFNIPFEFSIKELQFRHCFTAVLVIEVLQGSKE